MTRTSLRHLSLLVAVFGLLVAGAGTASASSHPGTVSVDLHADGSATIEITYRYDLTTTAEQEAFQQLKTNSGASAVFVQRFEDRLQSVAENAANATGRDMSVSNAAISFRTEGQTGIVELSVDWSGLASVEGQRLTVTEPFASGFETERSVEISGPDGATVASVSPQPDIRNTNLVSWDGGTDLQGLSVNFESVPETTTGAGGQTTTTGGSGPGFGPIAAGVALATLAGAGILARRD